MQNEEKEKSERKLAAQSALDEWKATREGEISGRRAENQQLADDYRNSEQRAKANNNPWERVIDNCEMNAGQYAGQKDVSRMR